MPTLPLVVTLNVPLFTFNPLVISRLPAKEFELVPENTPSPVTNKSSPTSKSRDTEALPIISSLVVGAVVPMPTLPVIIIFPAPGSVAE